MEEEADDDDKQIIIQQVLVHVIYTTYYGMDGAKVYLNVTLPISTESRVLVSINFKIFYSTYK